MTFSFKVEKKVQLILLTEMKKTGGGARAVLWRERAPCIRNMDVHTWGYANDVFKVIEPEDMTGIQ